MEPERIKPWRALTWPNRISIFRLLLVPPFVVLLLHQHPLDWARHAALGIFLVMAVSDFIDGALARKLNERTRLGAILDPLADKTLIICAVVLLSLPGSAVPGAKLPALVVVAVIGKDLWVIAGFFVVYLVTDRVRVRPTPAGKLCTLGQSVMVSAILLAPELNELAGPAGVRAGSVLAGTMGWIVAGLSLLAGVSYTRLGLRFIVQDAKPLNRKR